MNIYEKQHVLSFNGTNTYIDCGTNTNFAFSDSFSIETWIRPLNGNSSQAFIMSYGQTDFDLKLYQRNLVFGNLKSKSKIELDKWVHIAITIDATAQNNQLRIYLNGKLDISHNRPKSYANDAAIKLLIGLKESNADRKFQGDMASFSLWNRKKSALEIQQGMHDVPNPSAKGLVAFWKMDEGSGTTLTDSSKQKRKASLKGTVKWQQVENHEQVVRHDYSMLKSRYSQVLHFDGKGTYLDCGKDSAFLLPDSLTIEAWVKPMKFQQVASVILSHIYTDYELNFFQDRIMFQIPHTHQHHLQLGINKWMHLTASFNSKISTQNVKLYINGELVEVFNKSGKLALNTENPLFIGSRPGWNNGYFHGDMAGISLWSKERTAEEIKQDMYMFPEAGASGLVAHWPMTEGYGNIIHDRSGNNHHAKLVGNQNWRRVETAKEPPLPLPKEPKLPKASISGHNGEIHKLLHRVNQHQDGLIKKTRKEGYLNRAQARHDARTLIKTAHENAAKKVNSTRFQFLYFLSNGRLNAINPQGLITHDLPNTTRTQFTVDPKKMTHPTGIQLSPGDRVTIKYLSGTWGSSPNTTNLTAAGSSQYLANDRYTLPKAPEGALVGYFGGKFFLVGMGINFQASSAGELELAINDEFRPSNPEDTGKPFLGNTGSVTVEIIKSSANESVNYFMEDFLLKASSSGSFIFSAESLPSFAIKAYLTDGSEAITRFDLTSRPLAIALNSSTMQFYWLQSDGKILTGTEPRSQRLLFDIKKASTKGHLVFNPTNNILYYCQEQGIYSIKTNGTEHKIVVSDKEAPNPIGLEVDGQNVFWLDARLNKLRKSDLSRNSVVDLFSVHQPQPGLSLDHPADTKNHQLQEIYWSEIQESKIHLVRGSVDGSGHIEHLYDIPATGSKAIFSRQSAAHERQALAYRTLKQNQIQAHTQIQDKQAEQDALVHKKHKDLETTRTVKHNEVQRKGTEYEQKRKENKANLNQAKNDANNRIAHAQSAASNKRKHAHQQANSIKNNAYSKGHTIKSNAKGKRDKAQKEKDKY